MAFLLRVRYEDGGVAATRSISNLMLTVALARLGGRVDLSFVISLKILEESDFGSVNRSHNQFIILLNGEVTDSGRGDSEVGASSTATVNAGENTFWCWGDWRRWHRTLLYAGLMALAVRSGKIRALWESGPLRTSWKRSSRVP